MSLLPLRGESTAEPDEPRVVGLAGEDADETFEVLSSSTTREVLAALYEQPLTPSEVRDSVGTSLQNVHYHLDKLEEAALIEPAGVGYSEKGTEMTVYAPTSEAVVLFAGRRDDRSRLRSMLSRLFGVVLALGVGTATLRWFVESQTGRSVTEQAESGGGGDREFASSSGADGAAGGGAATGDGADTGGDAVTTADGGGGGDVSIASGGDGAATDGVEQATEAAPAATESPTSLDGAGQATEAATQTPADVARPAADTGATGAESIPQQVADALVAEPALAFLLGGLFVLCVVGVVWYTTR
ncbi:ArsR/SmtB family transcription factor [Halomarina rubra]|uniref:ArsR/SmtB family transcription factor n=1 Tax=Halomarina rubra TaxID=2071873 RepID=A0ABD6AZL5_9EURY|nr:winged helix-turn-helix domain-containing protein [Halomarina rubra]